MGLPIVISTNGYGVPVVESALGMPVEIAANGYGMPVVVSTNGYGMPVTGTTWVLMSGTQRPTLDIDFLGNRAAMGGDETLTPAGVLTCTRTSSAYADNLAGLWTLFPANTMRITDKGLLMEDNRSNYAIWGRDLTNVAWVKTNMTAAKDQAGVTGIAASASKITASAANATMLQPITLASGPRTFSAFVKRLVGTGTVEITMNGGTNWTAITPTSAWSRVSLSQTMANPSIGIRIGTSGDSIAVDFMQLENGGFLTSPIETAATALPRAIDDVSMPLGAWHNKPEGTFVCDEMLPLANVATQVAWYCDDNTATNRYGVRTAITSGGVGGVSVDAGVTTAAMGGVSFVAPNNTPFKSALRYITNNGAVNCFGSPIIADDVDVTFSQVVTTLHLGCRKTGVTLNEPRCGYIRRLTYYPTAKPNEELRRLSASAGAGASESWSESASETATNDC